MKNGIKVRIVETAEGYIVRTKLNSKKVELRATPSARTDYSDSYASVDSAQRAFRKWSEKNRVRNYTYELA